MGLMKISAVSAVVTSNVLFRIPPVGGKTSLSGALKKADVADLVADFIEMTPFMLANWSGMSRAPS
jgi:hypothetical protein